MSTSRSKLNGKLVINRIPKNLCWGTPSEFIVKIKEILGVDLIGNKGSDFVVVGHQIPSPDNKNRLWVRLTRSGIFQGFYLFQKSKWQRIHNYRGDEVNWIHGDSRQIPEGFQLIDASLNIPTDVVEHIVAQYLVDTSITTSKVYKYFAVRWIGAT